MCLLKTFGFLKPSIATVNINVMTSQKPSVECCLISERWINSWFRRVWKRHQTVCLVYSFALTAVVATLLCCLACMSLYFFITVFNSTVCQLHCNYFTLFLRACSSSSPLLLHRLFLSFHWSARFTSWQLSTLHDFLHSVESDWILRCSSELLVLSLAYPKLSYLALSYSCTSWSLCLMFIHHCLPLHNLRRSSRHHEILLAHQSYQTDPRPPHVLSHWTPAGLPDLWYPSLSTSLLTVRPFI